MRDPKKLSELAAASDQGRRAYHVGKTLADCPYAINDPRSGAWRDAWERCRRAVQDRKDDLHR